MKLGSLFSGIGGFELGLERAIPGLETVWQVEQVEFCQKVLKKHWPNAKIYDDVRNINKNNVEPIDILCGGFPCQDISLAGKGEGINGKKSGLWWEMHRIISELRPRIAIMENVPAITFRGLDTVLGSLSEIGYDAEWTIISAAQFGAPHVRKRWFCVAYPNNKHSKKQPKHTESMAETRLSKCRSRKNARENIFRWRSQSEESSYPQYSMCESHTIFSSSLEKKGNLQKRINAKCGSRQTSGVIKEPGYWKQFPTQPPLCNRNDGIPNRLAKLRALGNAIVPQCSQWIGEQILNSGLLEEIK